MGARETSLNQAFSLSKVLGIFFSGAGLFLFNREHPYVTGFISLGSFTSGFFFLSVVRVKTEETVVKYQRWFRWQAVPYSEIRECGESWMYGYIALRQYTFPWMRIYFARPYSGDSLFGLDKETISSIRSKIYAYKVLNKGLRSRYLLSQVHHLVLLVDISPVRPRYQFIPEKGMEVSVHSLLFRSWEWAEKFLLEGGASREDLDKTRDSLRKTKVALLETWG